MGLHPHQLPKGISAELASRDPFHSFNAPDVFTHPKGILELKLGHHPQATAPASLALLPQTGLNGGPAELLSRPSLPGPAAPPRAASGQRRKRAQPVLFGARISCEMRKEQRGLALGRRGPVSAQPFASPTALQA